MNDNSKKKGILKQTGLDASVHVEERYQKVHHGNNIELYRTAKGYSQEYMATQLGIAQQRFSDLEKQETIDEGILTKIADILGLGVEWLRDIPVHRASNLYCQNGSGVYFANTGNVTHTIVKPVEEVVEAYKGSLEQMNSAKDEIIAFQKGQLAKLEQNFEKERIYNQQLLERLGNLTVEKLQKNNK